MNTKSILVIDDDESVRWVINKALKKNGFALRIANDGESGWQCILQNLPDMVFCDLRMPGINGFDVLKKIRDHYPQLPVVIMTAHADMQSAVQSFEAGAFEFLAKPFDIDELVQLAHKATAQIELKNAPESAIAPIQRDELLGRSTAMQPVFRAVGRLARSHFTVLLLGESGSGKEVLARVLHQHSPRADGPFVALNMAAIPPDLIEAELFGYEKGAFTGAQQKNSGKFEQAANGTLFLDEIGDMPLTAQTRLLRVLSDGGYYRVGGAQLLQAQVRIIAATHQDLHQLVANGLFREDLFHRLNVVKIALPPLRERREDIALLLNYFLQRAASDAGISRKALAPEVLDTLQTYAWPGNVRQLENLARYLTVMAPGDIIHTADLPEEFLEIQENTAALDKLDSSWMEALRADIIAAAESGNENHVQQLMQELESLMVLTVLDVCTGHKQETARLLGWGRNTLTRYLQKMGVAGDGDPH